MTHSPQTQKTPEDRANTGGKSNRLATYIASWFPIRRELPAGRRSALMLLSFILPLLVWCLFAYIPFFHSDVKLFLSATGEEGSANLIEGDRIDRDFFETYVAKISAQNKAIEAGWPAFKAPDRWSKTPYLRENMRRMRRIKPIAEMNGWDISTASDQTLEDSELQAMLDQKLFAIWQDISSGKLVDKSGTLAAEDLEVIQKNAALMQKAHGQTFQNWKIMMPPLLQLLPKGNTATPVVLPAPHEVVQAGWQDFTTEPANNMPWMYERLGHSLKIVFFGFLMACAIGIPLGLICGSFDIFSQLFEPFTDFFRYMPAPTFAMLLIAIFDIHDGPKIALIFLGTFPHMVLMIAGTTRLMDRALIEAAQTLGAKKDQLLKLVIIPGILPNLYKDLRILLGWAWTWLVIAELIGTKTGLTDFIVTQGTRRNFDRVFPVIFCIGIIGFLTDQLLQQIGNRLFPWESDRKRGWFSKCCDLINAPILSLLDKHTTKAISISLGEASQIRGKQEVKVA